ncbi:LEA type 2 family protein [Desulfospira joergensenii]|uniref:LEA type 2 family protein n=1 Tax=Desulfospira joergensenii TaxID=53329 RepID=UPI0003B6A088|nr:LEA type 2 family protein [Desulfospira joergensenii]
MNQKIPILKLFLGSGILVLFLCCTACSVLKQDYETPVVSVTSFKAVPGQGMAPGFEVGLHVVNPNRSDLDLVGISYTLSIENHKIFTGVSNDLPLVPGYGEEDILLKGSLSLLGSMNLFSDLIRGGSRDKLSYRLDVKLDTGGFSPMIRVSKKGEFSFPAGGGQN